MDDLREVIARAIDPEAWDEEIIKDADYPIARKRVAESQERAFRGADAALAAIKQAGFVVVPAPWNVTEAMIDAGIQAMESEDAPAMVYSAMIEASNAP